MCSDSPSLIERLTASFSTSIDSPTTQRLIAGIALGMIPAHLIALAVIIIETQWSAFTSLVLTGTIIMTCTYFLARTRWYQWAGTWQTLTFFLGALAAGLISGRPIDLISTVLGIFVASLIWPVWASVMMGVVAVGVTILMALRDPTMLSDAVGAGAFIGLGTTLIAVTTVAHRQARAALADRTRELLESEQRFHDLLDNVPAIALMLDHRGRLTYVNPYLARLLDRSQDSLVGQDWFELALPNRIRKDMYHIFSRGVQSGQIPSTYDNPIRDGAGRERMIQWTNTVIPARGEKDIRVASIGVDVTERRLMQERLRRSEALLRAMLDSSQISYTIIDPTGKVIRASKVARQLAAQTFGVPLEPGAPIRYFVRNEDTENFAKNFAAALRGEYRIRQLSFETEQGGLWLEFRYFPVKQENGNITAICLTAENITDRKVAEEQHIALVAEQEKVRVLSQFIDDVSHDLKTPLTTLKTNLFLIRRVVNDEKASAWVERCQQQTDRINTLLDQMLTMTRLDKPFEQVFDFAPVELQDVMERAVAAYRERSETPAIILDVGHQPVTVEGDRGYLLRAIDALLLNAASYTQEPQPIWAVLDAEDQHARISVYDGGDALSRKDLEHLFERFFRREKHRPSRGDTGLGLPIVKRIVEAHAGTITASNHSERGVCVRITLPCKDKTAPHEDGAADE